MNAWEGQPMLVSYKAIGRNIRAARQKNGLTQVDGLYQEPVEGASFHEYGFETAL